MKCCDHDELSRSTTATRPLNTTWCESAMEKTRQVMSAIIRESL